MDLREPSNLNPVKIFDSVRLLTDNLIVVAGEDRLRKEAQKNATLLIKVLLRSFLNSKRIMEKYKMTGEAFDCLFDCLTVDPLKGVSENIMLG